MRSALTLDTDQRPLRRVRMPRRVSSSAIALSDMRPCARMSASTGAGSFANRSAFAAPSPQHRPALTDPPPHRRPIRFAQLPPAPSLPPQLITR